MRRNIWYNSAFLPMRRLVKLRIRSYRFVFSKKILLLLMLFVILPISFFFLLQSQLKVKHVICEMSDRSVCEEELNAELQKFLGMPMYTINAEEFERRALKGFPQLKSLNLTLQPPASIKMIGVRHEALYVAEAASSSAAFVVSENGFLLRQAKEEDMQQLKPRFILLSGQLGNPGERVEDHLHRSLRGAAMAIKNSSVPVESVEVVRPGQLELLLPGGKRGVIEGENAEVQLSALQQLLNTATISGQGIHSIDVRFTRPVLR